MSIRDLVEKPKKSIVCSISANFWIFAAVRILGRITSRSCSTQSVDDCTISNTEIKVVGRPPPFIAANTAYAG